MTDKATAQNIASANPVSKKEMKHIEDKSPDKRASTARGTGYFRPRERQDLSGHVCFDNELYEFYRTSELRANRIELAHRNGQITYKPYRNPVRAEKTPRIDYKGFDFRPPPVPDYMKPVERWNYEDDKTAIMSNKLFSTLNRLPRATNNSMSTQPSQQEVTPLPTDAYNKPEEIHVPTAREVPRSARPATVSGRVDIKEVESELLNTSLSEFKAKVDKDPLLMAKWRAEKAAKYVSSKKNAEDAPSPGVLQHEQNFLSGGFSSARRTYQQQPLPGRAKAKGTMLRNALKGNEKEDPVVVIKNLNFLREKLKETEQEIERQELRLSLMNKTKNYERPVTRPAL